MVKKRRLIKKTSTSSLNKTSKKTRTKIIDTIKEEDTVDIKNLSRQKLNNDEDCEDLSDSSLSDGEFLRKVAEEKKRKEKEPKKKSIKVSLRKPKVNKKKN